MIIDVRDFSKGHGITNNRTFSEVLSAPSEGIEPFRKKTCLNRVSRDQGTVFLWVFGSIITVSYNNLNTVMSSKEFPWG